jgi:hypothetical protein
LQQAARLRSSVLIGLKCAKLVAPSRVR